jgi:hypothetical protein
MPEVQRVETLSTIRRMHYVDGAQRAMIRDAELFIFEEYINYVRRNGGERLLLGPIARSQRLSYDQMCVEVQFTADVYRIIEERVNNSYLDMTHAEFMRGRTINTPPPDMQSPPAEPVIFPKINEPESSIEEATNQLLDSNRELPWEESK